MIGSDQNHLKIQDDFLTNFPNTFIFDDGSEHVSSIKNKEAMRFGRLGHPTVSEGPRPQQAVNKPSGAGAGGEEGVSEGVRFEDSKGSNIKLAKNCFIM